MTYYEIMRTNTNDLIDKMGINCTRTPVTESLSNMYIDETLTEGTSVTIKIFIKPKQENEYVFDKDGEIQKNNIFAMSKNTTTINKNDKLLIGTKTFRVMNVEEITAEGYVVYKKVNLFLI